MVTTDTDERGNILDNQDVPVDKIPASLLWDVKGRCSGAGTNIETTSKDLDFVGDPDIFRGRKVVEIGCGWAPFLDRLVSLGITSYQGVEPFNLSGEAIDKVEELKAEGTLGTDSGFYETDALTHLLDIPDNSHVLIAYAVFSDIYDLRQSLPRTNEMRRDYEICERYTELLLGRMYGIVEPGGFLFARYWGNALSIKEDKGKYRGKHMPWDKKFQEYGFKIDPKNSMLFWKR